MADTADVAIDELAAVVAATFVAKGMTADDAATVADVLIWANRRGYAGHGVARVPSYIRLIDGGDLDPRAQPILAPGARALIRVDARRAAGPVALRFAVRQALAAAADFGIGYASVVHTTHTGAIGYYVAEIADQGCVGLVLSAGPPRVAYHGAAVPSLSTSPIAFGAPRQDGPSLVLDMATSVVSSGSLRQAGLKGQSIPFGWALDDDGRPTDDPAAATTLLPLGGYKGSGLSLMVECLASILPGAPLLAPRLDGRAKGHSQNAVIIALSPEAFGDADAFRQEVDDLARTLKTLPTAEGHDAIRLPGERAAALSDERQATLTLPAALWAELQALVAPQT